MKSIVIGSGFGGIAAALRLKAKNHSVILIEKHLNCLLCKLTFCVSDAPLWRIPWKFGHGLTPGRG